MDLLSAFLGKTIAHILVRIDEWYGKSVSIRESAISYYKKHGKWPEYMSAQDIIKAKRYMGKWNIRTKIRTGNERVFSAYFFFLFEIQFLFICDRELKANIFLYKKEAFSLFYTLSR